MQNVNHCVHKIEGDKLKVVCPECGYETSINGHKFKNLKRYRRVCIKSKCGDIQRFVFERRNGVRKASLLNWVFYHIGSNGPVNFTDMRIIDISCDGICFQGKGELSSTPANGNKVLIKFKVNDKAGSMVTKKAAIKNIHDNYDHVKFYDNSIARNDLCFKILLHS